MMRELALFAGAGGRLLATNYLLGWRTVCAVEANSYCCGLLVQRQNDGLLPPFPIWDKIESFDAAQWSSFVDVVTAVIPARRAKFDAGSEGKEVQLDEDDGEDEFEHFLRVVIQTKAPVVFAESSSKTAITLAADRLAEMGYSSTIAELDATDLGADHSRRRFWLGSYAQPQIENKVREGFKNGKSPEFLCGVWRADPEDNRVSHGLADRVDRLAATGSGTIPSMVWQAWLTLQTHASQKAKIAA